MKLIKSFVHTASPDGWVVWSAVMFTRWWLLVDHCVLRNWDRILVRAVKGLISRAGMVSICPLLWQRDVINSNKPNQNLCPHSRCSGSYFDVIFLMYLVSSDFYFKATSSSSSSSTQFYSQEWARINVVVKHSIKSNKNQIAPLLCSPRKKQKYTLVLDGGPRKKVGTVEDEGNNY